MRAFLFVVDQQPAPSCGTRHEQSLQKQQSQCKRQRCHSPHSYALDARKRGGGIYICCRWCAKSNASNEIVAEAAGIFAAMRVQAVFSKACAVHWSLHVAQRASRDVSSVNESWHSFQHGHVDMRAECLQAYASVVSSMTDDYEQHVACPFGLYANVANATPRKSARGTAERVSKRCRVKVHAADTTRD